jgi:hypothetical protein
MKDMPEEQEEEKEEEEEEDSTHDCDPPNHKRACVACGVWRVACGAPGSRGSRRSMPCFPGQHA